MSSRADLNKFEVWARLSAKVRLNGPVKGAAMLKALGIAGAWPAAHARWTQLLLDALAEGDLQSAARYSSICAEVAAQSTEAAACSPTRPRAALRDCQLDCGHDTLRRALAGETKSGRAQRQPSE